MVGRRADGYHLLDSLVAFVDLADTLAVHKAERLSLEIDGPQGAPLTSEADNLVLQAARLLAERGGRAHGATIRLTKRIPVAAGLGGGSADAAATLRALSALWRLSLAERELFDIAGSLGADVPMCLSGGTTFASGIGDRLAPAPALPAAAILLVNPRVALPTRAVFAARSGGFSTAVEPRQGWRSLAELAGELSRHGNDLAPAAISLCPAIREVLDALDDAPGVRYAAMSGSGATCFGLFDSLEAARRAGEALPDTWWRHAGGFLG